MLCPTNLKHEALLRPLT